MYSNGTRSPITAKSPLQVNQNSSSSDFESEIVLELEQKRRELDEEITKFRAQKENEFREFERDLRANKKKRADMSPPIIKANGKSTGLEKPPSRTSSSSALNLLAGRVGNRQSYGMDIVKRRTTDESCHDPTSPKAGPSVSQPVVSLDKLNIRGETVISNPGRPHTPPTPTLLSKLPRSSSTSSLSSISSRSRQPKLHLSTPLPLSHPSPEEEKSRNSLTGLFTPSYISLIDSNSPHTKISSTTSETPSADGNEAATTPSSYKSEVLTDVLPLSSSSFPPHTTTSPGGHTHASKRAYTAPTVSPRRFPSALRTASGGAIGRKAKHVTFRLADSAIVEPSSSYEEGPSPQLEDDKNDKSGSGSRSPLRMSKSSQLHRTLSPDEEDEEAGVKPGMGMGDVIQRLNEYTIATAAEDGEELDLEVEEDVDGNDIEDEEEEEDIPMEISNRHEEDLEDDSDRHLMINYHEHEDENFEAQTVEEDGYFSPKAKHISTISPMPRGNSPLAPYRDGNWAELSSSDKDRLLFESRRHSDDIEDMRRRNLITVTSPQHDETGFSGGLRQSVDGGSGVGFFELDEELASPDAGQAKPFPFDDDLEEVKLSGKDHKRNKINGLGLSGTTKEDEIADQETNRSSAESASKFGVGSVPIDIVRPSMSVSSSWVGTFGH